MYDVYKVADPLTAQSYNNSNLERTGDTIMVNDEDDVEAERLSNFMKLRQVMDVVEIRNEVDKYLLEPPENLRNPNFDLLAWWQENSPRFLVISQIAKDVFGIPISTVASESAFKSAFSLGGRIVDPFCASLTPRMVEALVCTSDWLKAEEFSLYKDPTKEELEFYDALEKIETGKDKILAEFHNTPTVGHSGYLRTYKCIMRTFLWSGLKADVKRFAVACNTCERNKYESIHPPGYYSPCRFPKPYGKMPP
ncbi:unnamed protein product [Prunus brigantina]